MESPTHAGNNDFLCNDCHHQHQHHNQPRVHVCERKLHYLFVCLLIIFASLVPGKGMMTELR